MTGGASGGASGAAGGAGTVVGDVVEDLVVHSATLVEAAGAQPGTWVAVRGGEVVARGVGGGWREHAGGSGTEVLDADGALLTAGMVDLHGHGGGGAAHEEGPGAVLAAAAAHREHGTTRSVVSFVSDAVDVLAERLAGVADLVEEHPHVLGSHLEGPFLALERKGAHSPGALVDPTPAAVAHLLDAARGTLRQVTLDPRRDGAVEAARAFAAAGVVVAVGHTEATHDEAAAAFDAGARLLTHAFNAMPGLHHRAPGPVAAACGDERVVLELVLDGEHVHPAAAAVLLRAAAGRVALVTDAMAAAAGGEDGRYRLGGLDVVVSGGRAVVEGTDTLAGSTLTLDRALRTGVAAGLPLPVLVDAATAVPAGVLGLRGRLGALEPGRVADLVLLDDDLVVRSVRPSRRRVVPPGAPAGRR
ncbi:N-acetylglucosamine-6-phosphate deacetylase [uncultured Pseudokineococcus sp.]|uniref:N-acetylglucosamine-6-phosphate deacetylase n=1 Tax=uncultured Pseudokineococcus sp. TaxID=1642928 RepID=UPI00261DA324|nr:amidohydrolase family protein [uncultured Pseudokineococcus sp.]